MNSISILKYEDFYYNTPPICGEYYYPRNESKKTKLGYNFFGKDFNNSNSFVEGYNGNFKIKTYRGVRIGDSINVLFEKYGKKKLKEFDSGDIVYDYACNSRLTGECNTFDYKYFYNLINENVVTLKFVDYYYDNEKFTGIRFIIDDDLIRDILYFNKVNTKIYIITKFKPIFVKETLEINKKNEKVNKQKVKAKYKNGYKRWEDEIGYHEVKVLGEDEIPVRKSIKNDKKIFNKCKDILLAKMSSDKKYELEDLIVNELSITGLKYLISELVSSKEIKVLKDENENIKYILYTRELKQLEEEQEIIKNRDIYQNRILKSISFNYHKEYIDSFFEDKKFVLRYDKRKRTTIFFDRNPNPIEKAGIAILDSDKLKEFSNYVIDRIVYFKKDYTKSRSGFDLESWGLTVRFKGAKFESGGYGFGAFPLIAKNLKNDLIKYIKKNGEIKTNKEDIDRIQNIKSKEEIKYEKMEKDIAKLINKIFKEREK